MFTRTSLLAAILFAGVSLFGASEAQAQLASGPWELDFPGEETDWFLTTGEGGVLVGTGEDVIGVIQGVNFGSYTAGVIFALEFEGFIPLVDGGFFYSLDDSETEFEWQAFLISEAPTTISGVLLDL